MGLLPLLLFKPVAAAVELFGDCLLVVEEDEEESL